MILFIKLDRWFRSVQEYYKVQEILDKNKVTWRAVLEDYNTETADGILKVNIMLSVAQNEAERTSERIKFVNASKIQRKEVVTGTQPFGYAIKDRHVIVDPIEGSRLTEVINHYIYHRSIAYTLEWSNAKWGYTHSRTWLSSLLHKVDVYSGDHKGVVGYRPRLLDDDIIAEVKAVRASNFVSRKRTGRVHIFSGLLFCPECGRRLVAWTDTKVHHGRRRIYYLCSVHRNHGGCSFKNTIAEENIETELLQVVISQIEQISVEQTAQEDVKDERPKFKAQLRRLSDAYIIGGISDAEYKNKVADIKAKLSEAEHNLIKKKRTAAELRKIFNFDAMSAYEHLSQDNKKAFWNRTISRIDLNDRHVVSCTFK